MKISIENLSFDYKIKTLKKQNFFYKIRSLFIPDFKYIRALSDISLDLNPGELVAIVGENGAGKSTLIKLLTGIMKPTEGKIIIENYLSHKMGKQYLKKIGVVWGNRSQLWWDLKPYDSYFLYAKIFDIKKEIFEERVRKIKKSFEMEDFWDQPVRKLSLGQRMRADLGLNLLHNPQILFLDEPSIGLDVSIKRRIRKYIREWAISHNATIILTSHDLKDVSVICNRLIILQKGRLYYDGDITQVEAICENYPKIEFLFSANINLFEIQMRLKNKINVIECQIKSEVSISIILNNENDINTVLSFLEKIDPHLEMKKKHIEIEELLGLNLL